MKRLFLVLLVVMGHHALASQNKNVPLQATANQKRKHQYSKSEALSDPVLRDRVLPLARYRDGCGGEYNSSSGMIRHPLNGGQYHNYQNCIWIIRATDPINITFVSFDTESGYDYLYIRDGESNASPLLGTFNGVDIPSPVQTRTNSAYLIFSSDQTQTRTGFEIHWELSDMVHFTTRPMVETTNQTTAFTTNSSTSFSRPNITTESILSTSWPDYSTTVEPAPDTGCGGEYSSSSGIIRHPLSGSQYHNNQHCVWIIEASHPIKITFVSFNTEINHDYLFLHYGEGLEESIICHFNGNNIPTPLQLRNNSVYMHFISDGSVTQTGFELQWEPSASNTTYTAPLCNIDMVYHTTTHIFESNSTTESILSTSLLDYNTTLETDMVHLTTRPMIETTKQTTAFDTNFSTTFSRANITTDSISSTTESHYSTTLESGTGCGGEYNSSSGMIRHPLSGSQYDNNQNCVWIIRATESINITFVSFNTETRYDYLYVRDGKSNASPLLGTFNGDGIPSPVQTRTNAAYLRFTSDSSVTRTGFEIHWELSDMVHFTTRPMIETTNQTTAFTTNSSTIFSRPNKTTESISSTSWPVHSTTAEPDEGCGGEYNSSSGMIRHPSNGSQYRNNQNCIWIIRATDPINITFVSFATEIGYDYLYIRDGESNASLWLGTFSGYAIPSPVQTRTNAAYLRFTSDSSVTRTGFVIHWELSDMVHFTTRPMIETTNQTTTFTTNSSTTFSRPNITTESTLSTSLPVHSTTAEPDKGCGSEYNSSSGMIRHPLNGSHYRINQNCTWIIRATDPINITFVSFDTETRYDYLSVRDGEGKALLVLGIFDGASIPSPVQTRTGVAQLQFISDSSVTQTGFELHWNPSEICPDGYVEIGTQCMIMTNIKVNWDQAKATCEENSAQLVSLKDPMALRDYVKEHFPKSSFWVGGRYYRNPEGWQWLSGASINSSFSWGINGSGVQQAKGGKQNCMILRYFPIQDEQEYVKNRCNKKNYFICEKPKVIRE